MKNTNSPVDPEDDERIPGNRFGPETPLKWVLLPRPRHRRRPGGPSHWWVRVSDLLPPTPPEPPKRGPLPPPPDEGEPDTAAGQNTKDT
jgi:hypothetical protein